MTVLRERHPARSLRQSAARQIEDCTTGDTQTAAVRFDGEAQRAHRGAALYTGCRAPDTAVARHIKDMFTLASRYRTRGVQRVYAFNFFGLEDSSCGSICRFDAGLMRPDGRPRPVFAVFESRARRYSLTLTRVSARPPRR